jgi:hypothetical protein
MKNCIYEFLFEGNDNKIGQCQNCPSFSKCQEIKDKYNIKDAT